MLHRKDYKLHCEDLPTQANRRKQSHFYWDGFCIIKLWISKLSIFNLPEQLIKNGSVPIRLSHRYRLVA